MQANSREEIVQFDVLRIAATIAVICIHVSAGVVLNPDSTTLQWWSGNIWDAASSSCFPIFVILSGALLLTDARPSGPRNFYARRAVRILLPLLFWTGFYVVYRHVYDHIGPGELFKDTVKGYPYYHLWFLYMIIGLYAVTPALKILVASSDRTTLIILTACLFVVAAIDRTVSLATMSAHHDKAEPHTFLVLWLRFIPYFLAGYILTKWRPRVRVAAALGCALTCWAVLCLITAYAHSKGWQDPYFAYDSLDPSVIIASLTLFACFSSVPVSCSPAIAARLQSLAGLTLGIYLVHPLWLDVLRKIGVTGLLHPALIGIPLTAAAAFLLSAITTAAIRAMPILRRVV
jgi:surface polysaccharide O-acyltransferase-like enzyme